MSIGIDREFIGKISSRLRNFKWKSADLANFSCPLCGDSHKTKTKARGYFYRKTNNMFFRCHNCGEGRTLANFFREVAPDLYDQYVMSRFMSGDGGHSPFKAPTFEELKGPLLFGHGEKSSNEHPAISYLIPYPKFPDEAKSYLDNRKIPMDRRVELYYTDNMQEFANLVHPDKYKNRLSKYNGSPRIVFISRTRTGQPVSAGARDITGKSDMRYITLRFEGQDNEPAIYNQDKITKSETVYVVEGQFDSLFLPNCIAVSGSDLAKVLKTGQYVRAKTTYIFDNEPRNPQIVSIMTKCLHFGARMFIWPIGCRHKDINAAVINGLTPEFLLATINNNTVSGLEALAKFEAWRITR